METVSSNGHNGKNGARSLKGKVALVTGASRGIGRAIAIELGRLGANVALDYRSDSVHAESAATEIRELGVECITIQGDIAKKGDARRIIQEVLDKWQRLDILVNNAGITRDRSMRKMTEEDWGEVINVNLKDQTGQVLRTLTPREEKVIKMRFGLEDGSEHTLEEVGQSFAVTRERIRQIEAKALRKLRHPSRSRKLRAFMDGVRD